jgi:hypothetical protein
MNGNGVDFKPRTMNKAINPLEPAICIPILEDIATLGAARKQDIPLGKHKVAELCSRKLLKRLSTPFGIGYALDSHGAVLLGRSRKVTHSLDRVANGLIRRAVLEFLSSQSYTVEKVCSSSFMILRGPKNDAGEAETLFVSTRHNPLSARGARRLIRRYYGELLVDKAKLFIATSRPHTLKHLQKRYPESIILLDIRTLRHDVVS